MRRVGDLLPGLASALGLEEELMLSRLMKSWDALVAERVPPAAGACRVVGRAGSTLLIEADEPIVAQEIRLCGPELTSALAATPGGAGVRELRVRVRRV